MRDIPDAYIKAAKKKIQAEPPEPKMKDGKPVSMWMQLEFNFSSPQN